MKIVSHFELIFKPQSPASPPGVNVDRLIQGYFLEITNLETVPYSYSLEFIAVAPPAGTPNATFRSLAGNTLVFVDTPGSDNQQGILNGTLGDTRFTPSSGSITIAPQATALVAVLPSAFGPNPLDPTPLTQPNFEVRGFVRLGLPAVFRRSGRFFVREAQASGPVQVLVTPQNRATYFTATNAISAQTQASLPIVGGSAQMAIDPSQPFRFPLGQLADLDAIRPMIAMLEANPEMASPAMLALILRQLEPGKDVDALNAELANAEVPFTITARGGKGR